MLAKLRTIWRLMGGQRARYGGAIAALVAASCFMYLVPLVPQIVIDGVLTQDPSKTSGLVRRAVALAGGPETIAENLWVAAAIVLVLTGVAGTFTYLRGRLAAEASQRIARDVRDRLYDQLQHLPVAFHDTQRTGDLVQRCTSDVETLRLFLANQVVEIGRAILMMAVPIPLMLALDVRLTLVSVAVVPPIILFSALFFRRVQRQFTLVDEAEGTMTATLQENLTGIRVVRAFARQEFEKEKFSSAIGTFRGLSFRMYELMAWYWSLSDLLCMGQKALLVGVGGYWLATGQLAVGTFYFFIAAVNMFIWPMRMLGRILTDLGKAMVAIGRIQEILEAPRETKPRAGDDVSRPTRGEIVFENVSFAYGETAVLRELSLRAAPGETLAILGPSGAGKSTIVNLLLRFHDPDAGRILVDGVDLSELGRKDARGAVSVVMQEPFLYSKSVKENIRFGRSAAVEEEIHEAASTACVHESITAFDEGYDTLVGERGVTLSGGQRQRVAIARALLTNPALLVLDDALSAVDTETEQMIIRAVRRRHGHQTTILIAHRLSTVRHADKVIVLEAGALVQEGDHDTLVREEGLYRRLWTIQNAIEAESEAKAPERQSGADTGRQRRDRPPGGRSLSVGTQE